MNSAQAVVKFIQMHIVAFVLIYPSFGQLRIVSSWGH